MFTYGTDPEFFLRKKSGRLASAHNLVPGTKQEPAPLKSGGAIQADGTAVEFNIPPAQNGAEFAALVQAHLDEIRATLPDDYVFDFVPIRRYAPKFWEKLPNTAKEIGCDPELFVGHWHRIIPPKERYRGSGFHLHIGWTKGKEPGDEDHKFDCHQVVKALDNTLFQIQTVWDPYAPKRRNNTGYGLRGAHRIKSYGVEYRPLSSHLLAYPCLWKYVIEFVDHTLNQLLHEGKVQRLQAFFPSWYRDKDVAARDYLHNLARYYKYPEAPLDEFIQTRKELQANG